jgi:hypothetical protein
MAGNGGIALALCALAVAMGEAGSAAGENKWPQAANGAGAAIEDFGNDESRFAAGSDGAELCRFFRAYLFEPLSAQGVDEVSGQIAAWIYNNPALVLPRVTMLRVFLLQTERSGEYREEARRRVRAVSQAQGRMRAFLAGAAAIAGTAAIAAIPAGRPLARLALTEAVIDRAAAKSKSFSLELAARWTGRSAPLAVAGYAIGQVPKGPIEEDYALEKALIYTSDLFAQAPQAPSRYAEAIDPRAPEKEEDRVP